MGVPSHMLENEAVERPTLEEPECVSIDSSDTTEPIPKDNSRRNYYIAKLFLTVLCMCGGYFFVSVKMSGTLKEVAASTDSGAGEVADPGRGRVTGLLQSNDNPMVVIDGEIIRQGEQIYGVTVVSIEADRVEFSRDGVNWQQKVGDQPASGWVVAERRVGLLSTIPLPALFVAVGMIVCVIAVTLYKKRSA